MIFREQAIGGSHSGGDDVAERIEESALIVPGAVELCATREPACGDVEDSCCEVAHRLTVRRDCVERELRHLVPQPFALADAPVFDQLPGRIERLTVVEQPDPERWK